MGLSAKEAQSIAAYRERNSRIKDFEELKTIWEIEPNGNSKSYSDRAKFYRQLKEDTEGLISLLSEANKIKSQIELISSVRIQDYESAKVHDMIEETDYNFLLAQAKAFKSKIVEANNHLSIQNIHPIATTIIKTVAIIDTEKYEQHLSEIDTLNYKK